MFTVLFVCSGNTCRSPMAEMILKHLLKEKGLLQKIKVYSAGVHAFDDGDMSEHAKTVLAKYDIDAADFSVKRLDAEHVEKADLVLCVTKGHVAAVRAFFPKVMEKVHLLGSFASDGIDVSDPFGMGVKEYEECFWQLKDLIEKALPKIISLLKEDKR